MMAIAVKRYYRPDELARELDEPVRNVYFWIERGKIRVVKFGKKRKIERAEFMRVVENGIDH